MTRGEVFRLRAPRDRRGHEQTGGRYAVVLQDDELELSTVIVAPTSASALPTSFRPEVTVDSTRTRVLTEQLGAIDCTRLGASHGFLAHDELRAVDDALRLVLSLEN